MWLRNQIRGSSDRCLHAGRGNFCFAFLPSASSVGHFAIQMGSVSEILNVPDRPTQPWFPVHHDTVGESPMDFPSGPWLLTQPSIRHKPPMPGKHQTPGCRVWIDLTRDWDYPKEPLPPCRHPCEQSPKANMGKILPRRRDNELFNHWRIGVPGTSTPWLKGELQCRKYSMERLICLSKTACQQSMGSHPLKVNLWRATII